MTIDNISLNEHPTVIVPTGQPGPFEGWGIRIG
jgi:hypothetical protein